MKWIGLTGGIASGKSTVAQMLHRRGIPVVDADRLAKQAVEKDSAGLTSIVQTFGKEILTKVGDLDREKLAQIVFSNPTSLELLEAIIHPLVQQEALSQRKWLEQQGTEFAFYDVPLLFEKKLHAQFDHVVLVSTSEFLQIERLKKRNKWSDEQIQARLQSQIPLSEKAAGADYVLVNDADLSSLEIQVDELLAQLVVN